jgi:hypothetical protein
MLTRRKFLATTLCSVAATRFRMHGQSEVRVVLTIPKDATGPNLPIDFVGLSYEVQQLADRSFFSAQNNGLIREFKALSSTGVLRLGGNTSEFAYWKPKPDSPEPEHPQVRQSGTWHSFFTPQVGTASTASGWARIHRHAPARKRSL